MLEQFPEQIGRYHIEKQIGQGAMGRVFQGRDPELDRLVAIKVIRDPGLARKEAASFSERFKNEARAAAKLNHPSIVQIFDVGEEEFIGPFLVFEFVSGQTLQDRLAEVGKLDREEVVRIAREVAAAIDFAHLHGIVHRDIKPANILLPEKGPAKLADFGVARLPDAMLTREGQFLGTPCYSAPETLSEGLYSAASDLFSFATVLYEVLTGVRAFQGLDAISVAQAVIESIPKKPSEQNVSLSAQVDQVFTIAFSKKPNQRYALASDFVADLALALDVGGSSSWSTSFRSLRTSSDHRSSLSKWVLLFILGMGVLFGSWWFQTHPEKLEQISHALFSTSKDPSFITGAGGIGGASDPSEADEPTLSEKPVIVEKKETIKGNTTLDGEVVGGYQPFNSQGDMQGAGGDESLQKNARVLSKVKLAEMTLWEKEEKAKDAFFQAKKFWELGDSQQAAKAIEDAYYFDPENPEILSLRKKILKKHPTKKVLNPNSANSNVGGVEAVKKVDETTGAKIGKNAAPDTERQDNEKSQHIRSEGAAGGPP